MKKETEIIAFASQKGGCGKSMASIMLANELVYEDKKEVELLDIDPPQYTSANLRIDELNRIKRITEKIDKDEQLEADEKTYWKLFQKSYKMCPTIKEKLNVRGVPLEGRKRYQAASQIIDELEHQGKKIIICDTMGTLSDPDLFNFLSTKVTRIYVPIETEEGSMKSSIASFLVYLKLLEKSTSLKEVIGFFNRYRITEKDQTKCMIAAMAIAMQKKLPLFIKNNQPLLFEDKSCFKSNTVKSTFISATLSPAYKNSQGHLLIKEIRKHILK